MTPREALKNWHNAIEIIEALETKGFVIVPKEATSDMMLVGVMAAGDAPNASWVGAGRPGWVQVRAAWEAMVELGKREGINNDRPRRR